MSETLSRPQRLDAAIAAAENGPGTYVVTLTHDNGSCRFHIHARSAESAVGRICHLERAPRSAVQTITFTEAT